MADLYTGLENGGIDSGTAGNVIIECIANEAITLGSPVKLASIPTGERLPRVEPTGSQGIAILGVVVAGVNDGTFSGSDVSASIAAGDAVSVCIFGRCKVRVNGSTGAIAIGDKLTADSQDGFAEIAAASDEVFGRALQASTGAEDFIACLVNPEGVL